jgi:hypothetical protein
VGAADNSARCSEEAYEEFKSSAGAELTEALVENKRSLRTAKQKQKVRVIFYVHINVMS